MSTYYERNHTHCWHQKYGPVWMVVPDGHTVQECCICHSMRTIHVDHAPHTWPR